MALPISCIFFAAYELSTSSAVPTLFGPLKPNNRKNNDLFPTHNKKSSTSTHATTTTINASPSPSFSFLSTSLHYSSPSSTPASPSQAFAGLGIHTSPLPPLPLLSPLLSPPPRPDSAWRAVHPPLHAFRHAHTVPSVRRVAPSSPGMSPRCVGSYASLRSGAATLSVGGMQQDSSFGSRYGYGNGTVNGTAGNVPRPPSSRSVSSSAGSSRSSSLLRSSPLRTVTSVGELEVWETEVKRGTEEGKVGSRRRGIREGAGARELRVLDLKAVEVAVREVHPATREELGDANVRKIERKADDIPMIPEVERVGAIAWPMEWEIGVALGGDCRSDASMTEHNETERMWDEAKPIVGRIATEEYPQESPDIEVPPLQISKKRSTGVGDMRNGRDETKKMNSLGTLRRFALERSRNERPEMNFLYDERLS
ncbi:MAG: hypothetical protein Q9165_004894 [Trypethelium subeluteriae]